MGAPKGNLNSVKNATRLRPLSVGVLPKQLSRATRDVRKYRVYLEDAVIREHGRIDDEQAHWIDAACASELHVMVCRWLMRNKFDSMGHADILACSREIPRAKADRNRAVERLKLCNGESIIDALYATPTEVSTDDRDSDDPDTGAPV